MCVYALPRSTSDQGRKVQSAPAALPQAFRLEPPSPFAAPDLSHGDAGVDANVGHRYVSLTRLPVSGYAQTRRFCPTMSRPVGVTVSWKPIKNLKTEPSEPMPMKFPSAVTLTLWVLLFASTWSAAM